MKNALYIMILAAMFYFVFTGIGGFTTLLLGLGFFITCVIFWAPFVFVVALAYWIIKKIEKHEKDEQSKD